MPTQKEIVDTVSLALQKKDFTNQAVLVLKKATGHVLGRVQQNIDAQLKEDSNTVIEEFCRNLATKLSKMGQNWYDSVTNELVIYPSGTRLIWRDGPMTTIFVEQPPQVRTIYVNKRGEDGVSADTYHLSFPYCVFVAGFNNGEFAGFNIGVRKTPMTSLDDEIYNPPVANVNGHCTVCMGNQFKIPPNLNLTEKVNYVISSFWQSRFTHEGSDALNAFLKRNGLTLDTWESRTRENPLLAVEPKIEYQSPMKLRSLLKATANGTSVKESAALITQMKQEIITAVGTLGGDVKNLLQDLDLNVENRDKAHLETLQVILKEIIVQAYAELWEYLQRQLNDERNKLQQELTVSAKKLREEFMTLAGYTKKATW